MPIANRAFTFGVLNKSPEPAYFFFVLRAVPPATKKASQRPGHLRWAETDRLVAYDMLAGPAPLVLPSHVALAKADMRLPVQPPAGEDDWSLSSADLAPLGIDVAHAIDDLGDVGVHGEVLTVTKFLPKNTSTLVEPRPHEGHALYAYTLGVDTPANGRSIVTIEHWQCPAGFEPTLDEDGNVLNADKEVAKLGELTLVFPTATEAWLLKARVMYPRVFALLGRLSTLTWPGATPGRGRLSPGIRRVLSLVARRHSV